MNKLFEYIPVIGSAISAMESETKKGELDKESLIKDLIRDVIKLVAAYLALGAGV